jgi:hypothetical protein
MMYNLIVIAALLLTSVAMGVSLAHVLEWPGKRRLSRDQYFAVQAIYYPGFTIGGIAEPLSIAVVLVLLVTTPFATRAFWLVALSLAALIVVQAVFWLITQPVNKYWLEGIDTGTAAKRFFGAVGSGAASDWMTLRDRWEWSHIARAIAAAVAFLLLVVAAVTPAPASFK